MLTRIVLFLCVIVYFFCHVNSQFRFGCDDFCKEQDECPEFDCGNGTLIRNGTTCGCCDICIESLSEGEPCEAALFAIIPRQACGPGLACDKATKKCAPANTQCVKDRANFYNQLLFEEFPNQKSAPVCDEQGFYKSLVCQSDIVCYCVDKDGNRIFGTEVAPDIVGEGGSPDPEKMEAYCNCSRDFVEFPKEAPDGNFLRCLPNGHYDPLQCSENWCYCMEDANPDTVDEARFNTSLRDLKCYDEDVHGHIDPTFRTRCWKERIGLKRVVRKHEMQGIALIGLDLPRCDLDGSYAPLQCNKDSCYCVNKEGEEFGGYRVPRNSKEAKDMDCRCARDKDLISHVTKKTENMKRFLERYSCSKNGNYV
ncbi:nidogen-2 [Caerostris darwini]|uniref:Nidogen-2 n=1 Tax=Caerostris darwini TaxID=1538125 RepID=A0AAV4N6D5_9ARAC|nr:nidogen-2 [Caerostris darwini]